MKINTLLENQQPTNKQIMRFLLVVQDFLLEQYPNFKTEISKQTECTEDLPLSIKWYIADYIIEITGEATNTLLRVWFKSTDSVNEYKSYLFPIDTLYTADEIYFDLKLFMNLLVRGSMKILQNCHDGVIPSIKPYLKN